MEDKNTPLRIVLLGYMGSGKSRVGSELARHLGLPFTDLDAYIESKVGMPIREIFEKKGEIFFRRQEHALLKNLLSSEKPGVLSLGGGTPAYAVNMYLVEAATPHTVYLQHSIPALVARLERERAARPLIAHIAPEELYDFIGKHLFDRVPFYSRARHTVSCDGKSPAQIVADIEEKLG